MCVVVVGVIVVGAVAGGVVVILCLQINVILKQFFPKLTSSKPAVR